MTISRARLRAIRTLMTFVLLTSFAGACGGDADVDLPEPAPPQPVPTAPPPPELTAEEQQAVEEVQALIDEFLTVYVEIVTAGEPGTDSVMARFPRGFPIFAVNNEIVYNFLEDRRLEGQLHWEFVEVIEVDMNHVVTDREEEQTIPVVRLRYCVDATDWQTVDKNTGEPVEPGEHRLLDPFGQRYLVTVGASFHDLTLTGPGENPYWHVDEWENDQEQPC